MEAMELNGTIVDRETIREWLLSKHTILWSDWIITRPGQQEKAIDWVMKEMGALSAFASKPTDVPDPGLNDGPGPSASFRALTAA